MQTGRMTVLQVDRDEAQFLCPEPRRWTRVSKADATGLAVGDIVSVEQRDGQLLSVRVVRNGH
jgi:hypothetical protein